MAETPLAAYAARVRRLDYQLPQAKRHTFDAM
jgi:hypothetical protein